MVPKANVALLDAGDPVPGCQADVTPGVSPAAAAGDHAWCMLLLLAAADICGEALLAPAAGVNGGGEGSADSVCLAATPAAVLCSGRCPKGWLCGE